MLQPPLLLILAAALWRLSEARVIPGQVDILLENIQLANMLLGCKLTLPRLNGVYDENLQQQIDCN